MTVDVSPPVAETTAAVEPRPARAAGEARAQLTVVGGQLASGLGNFAFALVAARLLPSSSYAGVAVFLSLYLLLSLPAGSLAAGAAIAPQRLAALRPFVLLTGIAVGVVVAGVALPAGSLLHLPAGLLVALGAACPAAALFGIDRGVLYGAGRHTAIAQSLLAESAVRLGAGVVLTRLFGVSGAAVAVVASGYVGVWVARRARPRGPLAAAVPPSNDMASANGRRTAWVVSLAFLLFTIIQSQDLLVAKVVLSAGAAGHFAVLSTIGGAVAFATATIPLVLLPSAARRRPGATATAVGLAAGLGGLGVLVGLAAPDLLVTTLFGHTHRSVAHLVALYLAAMALIGVSRVLAARHCTEGRGRFVIGVLAVGGALQLLLLILTAHSPAAVARSTLLASLAVTGGLVAPDTVRWLRDGPTRPSSRWSGTRVGAALQRRDVRLVLAAMVVGLGVRLLVTRGIWVDEATSINQAQMPWGAMLHNVQSTDVHPPLHYAVLWVTVRVLGHSEMAVRVPSILAGVALIPVVYLLGKELYDRRTGLLAGGFCIVAPFAVWYSQEARMYGLFMLFTALAVLGQVRAVRRGWARDWALYALASAAMVWTQYFAFLPLLIQQGAFVALLWQRRGDRERRRRLARGWVLSLGAVVVLLLPLVPFFRAEWAAYQHRHALSTLPSQAGLISSGKNGVSVYSAIADFIWIEWGYHSDAAMAHLAALWPLGMLAAFLTLGRGRSRVTTLLVSLALLPPALLFVVGIKRSDLFDARYFSGTVPIMLLLTARAATRLASSRRALTAVGAAVSLTLCLGLVDQQLNGANPRRYDFRGALSRVEAQARPGDVLLYDPEFVSTVIHYYAPHLRTLPLARANAIPPGTKGVYVLATIRLGNDRAVQAQVGKALADLEEGRRLVGHIQRPNVTVWELR